MRDYTGAIDPKNHGMYSKDTNNDPRFNHCLKKEIDGKVPMGLKESESKSKLLTNGEARIGTPVDLFIKLVETREFREWSIHSFVTRDGSIVNFYGTVKNSPVKMDELAIGDCVEVRGRIAKYGQWKGDLTTRISHVKIISNKGKKVEKSS